MTAIPETMTLDGVTYDARLTHRYPTPEELASLAQDVQVTSARMTSADAALEVARSEVARLEAQLRGVLERRRTANAMLVLRVEGYELIPR